MRLIDADAFIEENKDIIDCEIDHPKYQDTLRELIEQAPTVERPHGEWTSNGNDLEAICSVCGEALPYSDEYDYETNFCPNCGASMVKKEGETE